MKIGDKVSFLSETGGGIVAGFQGKNIVLVEDEDGFQIPTPISEIVVVTNNDYSSSKIVAKTKSNSSSGKSVKALLSEDLNPMEEIMQEDIADKDIKFKKAPEERKGGNALACYLAFVPINIKELTSTHFKIYLVNDCNYFLQYSFVIAEENAWSLYSNGEIAPNTNLFIDEIEMEKLNILQKVGFQLFAYKKNKTFILKPIINIQLKLDLVKFYKLNSFKKTLYFDTPALLYTILENDKVLQPLQVNATELKTNMYKHEDNLNNQTDYQTKTKLLNSRGEIVVDLHIDKLVDSTNGMSHTDILNYQIEKFKEYLEAYRDKKGTKIIFIHGKGDGVLRNTIIKTLNYQYKKYLYQDASFQEYGYGATQVTIK